MCDTRHLVVQAGFRAGAERARRIAGALVTIARSASARTATTALRVEREQKAREDGRADAADAPRAP
jgi:hypothetical protein